MEADPDSSSSRARAQRAVAAIAVSMIALVCTAVAYAHPSLPWPATATSKNPTGALQSAYSVSAVDFIDSKTGWVVAQFPSGNVAILHTTDGGTSWTRQLSLSGNGHAQYIKFFDMIVGVFAVLGGSPVLYHTYDGGASWAATPTLSPDASLLSVSFIDSRHGWMLARQTGETPGSPANLYRTEDRGRSWINLGQPLPIPRQAYQVRFSSLTTGWLATSGPEPYAYRSEDLGDSWSPVALPSPRGAWPASGQFFVGVQPTSGGGALASIVYFPPVKGRSGVGGSIRAFPPLTVRVFDGGKPDTYTYTTVLDRLSIGGRAGAQAPNETVLSTVDDGTTWTPIRPPSGAGAIGYFDAADWWWVGAGSLSRTTDGGVSWTDPETIGVVEPLPGSLQLLDDAHAWLAASVGSRPVLESTDDAGLHWRIVLLPAVVDSPQALT
ncbi:MAG TPA: YCF48-related protein [Candidatus Dormibacteraeota bacterium]|nr:YCF48-related protein [Candidatus Dormibacteraeota bacterium]